jgi:hypothetical protein
LRHPKVPYRESIKSGWRKDPFGSLKPFEKILKASMSRVGAVEIGGGAKAFIVAEKYNFLWGLK